MKLKIGPNIDENRVRLDFKSTPDKPKNTPSYIIHSSQADAFVKKYNKQDEELKFVTFISVALTSVGVFGATRRNSTLITKSKLLPALISLASGSVVGALISSVISYKLKNDLMDKYNVLPYHKQ